MHKTPALFEIFRVLHYTQAYTHSKSWSPNIFIFLMLEVQYFPDQLTSDHLQQILKPIKQRAGGGALRRYNLWGAGGRLGQKESYSSWAEGGRRLQHSSPTRCPSGTCCHVQGRLCPAPHTASSTALPTPQPKHSRNLIDMLQSPQAPAQYAHQKCRRANPVILNLISIQLRWDTLFPSLNLTGMVQSNPMK